LNVAGDGSLMFWFAPNWASAGNTNENGAGPGVWGRLIETGTTNGALGWWSLYLDSGGSNLYFSARDGNGHFTNYLSAQADFASNSWSLIALDWSSTNTVLFVNGECAAVGPGISVLPNTNALTNGFTIGSDLATGHLQMHGAMSGLTTYNFPLSTNDVLSAWVLDGIFYFPNSSQLGNFTNAPFSPAATGAGYDVVSGQGFLQVTGANDNCAQTNGGVWITNVTASPGSNGSVNLTFEVAGGNPGWAYDVFGTGALAWPKTNSLWSWLGQAYPCQTNVIDGFTNSAVYLILGTPQDSYTNGLTDAFEWLVLHQNPADGSQSGIPDGWAVLFGLNPLDPSLASEDPDRDGLSNLQEYLYGANPQVSEGFAVWVSQPAGATGMP
jgi:hypothetical protein